MLLQGLQRYRAPGEHRGQPSLHPAPYRDFRAGKSPATFGELLQEKHPIGDLRRVDCPAILAEFNCFVDIVALQVDLEVVPALRVDKVAYRPGAPEAFASRQLYHAAAVDIFTPPAARRHEGVYLAFVVGVAGDDGADVARRQVRSVQVDMVSAAPVRRSPISSKAVATLRASWMPSSPRKTGLTSSKPPRTLESLTIFQ